MGETFSPAPSPTTATTTTWWVGCLLLSGIKGPAAFTANQQSGLQEARQNEGFFRFGKYSAFSLSNNRFPSFLLAFGIADMF
jgi:hypothetical protein